MPEFVHHHIVFDHKIKNRKVSNTIKENLKSNGNCCNPKRSKNFSYIAAGVGVLEVGAIIAFGFPLAILMVIALVVTLCYGGYHRHKAMLAKPYMREGSEYIICLGSESSSTLSSAPWAEDPGLSKSWANFVDGCRRYEDLLSKMPEGDLVSDQMFFSTVEEIYALFDHTYQTGRTIARHRMEREFAAIRSATEKFEEFIEKSSSIYSTLRFTANAERLTSIDTNLDAMNEVAFSKIASLRELENPNASSRVSSDDSPKKIVVSQATDASTTHVESKKNKTPKTINQGS